MGKREDTVRFVHGRLHPFRLGEVHGQRLVADDMDARLEEGDGGIGMDVIGRHDSHRLDAIGARGLCLGHGRVVAVAPGGVQLQ